MVAIYADGMYDHGSTFQNASDRVSWERTFAVGTDGQRRMAQAMITANPETPAGEIRAKMTTTTRPQDLEPVGVWHAPTLDDVLGTTPQPDTGHMYDRAPTDFSGTPAGLSSSSTPSISGL